MASSIVVTFNPVACHFQMVRNINHIFYSEETSIFFKQDGQKCQICVLLGAFPTKELTALLIRKCQDKEMSRIMIE